MTSLEPKLLLRHLQGSQGSDFTQGCSIVFMLLSLSLTGCGADGGQGLTSCTHSTLPACGTVSLTWDPVNDASVIGYYIHYGKQSSDQPGSCAYDELQFVSSPQGTVTGLDLGSTYYFAVSAYNGVEGACSNEVSAHT